MRIGIHKIGFASGLPNKLDFNGMFTEVNKITKILENFGHKVEYVNLLPIPDFSFYDNYFDTIFVFNGYENSTSNLKLLRPFTIELNYILTDSRFYEESKSYLVDNYFVQGPLKMYDKPTYNSYLHKLPLYRSKNFLKYNNTKYSFTFGGSVRERKAKIIEYILRPHVNYHLRFEEIDLDTRIPNNEYMDKLAETKFGIVLINKLDTEIGSITWRYYEYLANGVLTFVDRESDPMDLLLPANNYMKVDSYFEMLQKINELNKSEALAMEIAQNQLNKLYAKDITGETFVNSLIANRELNVTNVRQ